MKKELKKKSPQNKFMQKTQNILNEKTISELIEKNKNSKPKKISAILKKALGKKGLNLKETACLLGADDKKSTEAIFKAAGTIKREIYGERLVLFAPIYISNFCVNDCRYCAFHRRNSAQRKKLTMGELKKEVKIIEDMGHKRLLLECGEDPQKNTIDYVINCIKTIYKTKSKNGEIRRVNVNIAATTIENYRKLKNAGIGTYQLFQETYHKKTYEKMHRGPKANYERQIFAFDRAFRAGINDMGLGVLFGLYDWKFEVLALVSHAQYLEKKFGVGPHTISVPRWQPAETTGWNSPPNPVSEKNLLKIIAILRLAVPYTGIIISTREKPEIRNKAFEIGVSQTSAASKTSPGSYGKNDGLSQFSLSDQRTVNEIIESILKQGLLPSFCTACYRLGRTGHEFMDVAKPGKIKNICRPNAILTFKEYLEDYAPKKTKRLGLKIINKYLNQIYDPGAKKETKSRLKIIENGKRNICF